MKKFTLSFVALTVFAISLVAQVTLPPNGDNQKSEFSQYMGLVKITVSYSSPNVEGRQIWGELVPYGMTNFNVGKSTRQNPSPWRVGANENTTITFSHDVQVEGNHIKAGVYGLHMIPDQTEWIVIFSNNSTSWGSFFYTPVEDALRVIVKPVKSEFNEWLTFNFTDRFQNSCTLQLKWEHLTIPVQLKVPNGDDLYVQKIREEAQGAKGFQGPQFMAWQNWVQAANYCAIKKINLDEAMSWLDTYLNRGLKYYSLLESKSNVLVAMGKQEDAAATMREAIGLSDATVIQIDRYGRALIEQGRFKEALEVFEINLKRYAAHAISRMGMAYGHSAFGDYKKALKFAKDALSVETNSARKAIIESAIKKLEHAQDIN